MDCAAAVGVGGPALSAEADMHRGFLILVTTDFGFAIHSARNTFTFHSRITLLRSHYLDF
jgi:hypothetical protein